jgi:SAM-dependent methyltransferase
MAKHPLEFLRRVNNLHMTPFTSLSQQPPALSASRAVIHCPLCGSDRITPRDAASALCAECGLLINRQTHALDYSDGGGQAIPDAAKMAWRLENARYRFRLIAPFLREHTAFIDIGCGSGEMLEISRAFFPHHAGFDTNTTLVRYAQQRGLNAFNAAFSADALGETLRTQRKVFALSHVIEHLARPLDILGTVYDAMAPGDLLYLEVPLYTGQSFATLGYAWSLWNAEHVALYSPQALSFIAHHFGLTVLQRGTRIFARGSRSRKTAIRLLLHAPLRFALTTLQKPPCHSMADIMIADYGYALLQKPSIKPEMP